MGNIINFGQRKDELARREYDEMELACKRAEFAVRTNHLGYIVDLDLMMEGWLPISSIPIDKDFFIRRGWVQKMKANTREELSERKDGTPCMVIYIESNNLLGNGFGYGPVFS